MTEHVRKMLDHLKSKEYRKNRVNNEGYDVTDKVNDVPEIMQHTVALEDMISIEEPVIFDGDIFGFNRHNVYCPKYTNANGKVITAITGNVTPNYARAISRGLDDMLEDIKAREKGADADKAIFYEAMRRDLVAILDISDRYLEAAEKAGNVRLANALKTVPHKPATSFYEACVFFKVIVYGLRCAWHTHIGLGRFDQYMCPYFLKDIEAGVSKEELFETLELFFITLDVDTDIYFGVQQGDNGQSIMIGGYDKDGNDQFNELSRMCMDASLELSLIAPKINVRVNKTTPIEFYDYCTKLTKQGLGFPQYCNDDVVIPYLISMGYDEADAYDYTVAACWEFIIPGCGYDVPNRTYFIYPLAVSNAVRAHLKDCKTFDELLVYVREEIEALCEERIAQYKDAYDSTYTDLRAHPLSLFIDGCIEKGLDLNQGGAKYNNYGSHGVGLADAADSLAAIKKTVFEDKTLTADELITVLEANFEGYESVRNMLLECPRMGNNDDYVDDLALWLMNGFVESLNGKPTGRGGIWRAGTGSAQNYATAAYKCPATSNGRYAGDVYSCSYSPSISSKLNGPLSVIQSFTKFDLSRICNGGPLTMELHDTVFRNAEGEHKVAQLVYTFIQLGGHQLQLNAINRERLLAAQANPDDYPSLIVRVWGWSGYFRELDKAYQDHIIRRTEFC